MKLLVAAALLLATPAFAQPHGASDPAAGGNMREPNMANPQEQTNQGMNPANARPSAGADDAASSPTPTLGRQMTPTR